MQLVPRRQCLIWKRIQWLRKTGLSGLFSSSASSFEIRQSKDQISWLECDFARTSSEVVHSASRASMGQRFHISSLAHFAPGVLLHMKTRLLIRSCTSMYHQVVIINLTTCSPSSPATHSQDARCSAAEPQNGFASHWLPRH